MYGKNLQIFTLLEIQLLDSTCNNQVTIITLITIKCRSPKERSSRLPVGKKFSFIFCPWKGFRTHVSKIVQLFSNSLFLGRQKPKMIFGQYTRVDSDRKCKFHRFCPARSDCNNIAHAILSCYKLQGAFNQFNEKIWKLQLKYFSYKRDQRRSFASTFICMSKFTNLYERILKMQALIGLKDCHKPMGISVAFIHQHLKDNANPRVCLIALL